MAFRMAFRRALLRPERNDHRLALGDQISLMARFGEFLFLLRDGVAQIGELAIELFVVQPQQNGGKREGRRDRQQRGPPACEDSAVCGRPGFRVREAAARTFGRCDHLTHEGFLHAGRGSHGRRSEGEDRHASARFGDFFGAIRAGCYVRFERSAFGVIEGA